jgi:hypothetical protein
MKAGSGHGALIAAALTVLWAVAVFAAAGCQNPAAAQEEEQQQEEQEEQQEEEEISLYFDGNGGFEVLREDGSNALEGANVIYKDREPSRLVLDAGEGWTDPVWHVDGAAAGTGSSLILEARLYRETVHTLTFNGSRGGLPYSASIPFHVSAVRAADILWTQTEDDSSRTEFDLAAWTGDGTVSEQWHLSITEQPWAYFAVHKREFQAITVEGEDQGKVRRAAPGEILDGSQATDTFEVFAVDTGDLLFEEGERNFALIVTEPGREQSKTVAVSLAVKPRLTGAALFRVLEEGRLERITAGNIANHANDLYGAHKQNGFPEWGIDIERVSGLEGALKWLDSYAQSGTAEAWSEYLIRVEKDEVLPKTTLSCYRTKSSVLADYVRVRIRGHGTERRITHDIGNTSSTYQKEGGSSIDQGTGFLNVGEGGSSTFSGLSHIALHLENQITVDAASGADPNFPLLGGPIQHIVTVGRNCAFILEAGARLVNFNSPSYAVIEVTDFAIFMLRGGELSNCRKGLHLVRVVGGNTPKYVYHSGTFWDNDSNFVTVNGAVKLYNDSAFIDPDFTP